MSAAERNTVIVEIDIEMFADERDAGRPVVDVREPDEYSEAHVSGAVLIPLGQLADRLDELPAGDLLVICRSGARSMRACELLVGVGREGTNVAGGTLAWIESGRPVLSGPERG